MRHGDVRVDKWEVTEVEVDDQPAVRLDMWIWGNRQLTVHLRRDGDVLRPWQKEEKSGFVGLVDSEIAIAEQILEHRGYEIAEDEIWE